MTLPPHSEQTSREQLDHMLQEASTSCQNKQFEKAENEYQAILKIQADHPEANYSLGLLLLQKKQASASLSYFETALDKRPEYGPYWLTYIDALDQAGQLDVARQVFEMAQQAGLQGEDVDALKARLNINPKEATKQPESSVQLQATPTNPVSNSLPEQQDIDTLLSLYQDGRITECEQLALAILNCFPSHGLSWKVLGAALKRQERLEEAIIAMKQAALLLPQDHEAHNNLGLTLKSQGNLSESETILRLALTLKEDFVEAHNNLGVTLMAQGRFAESEACFRQALHIQPEYVEAYCNLGINLKNQGRYADSEATFQHALQLRPSYAEVWSNLGNLLQGQERLSEAEASLRKALELNPDFAIAYNNLASTLQCQGHLEESVYCFHKALKLKPDYPEAYDGLLFVSNYHPDNSSEDLFQLYREYDERFGLPHQEQWKPHSNTPNSNRRLKVGYVSPAFYSHPVLHFLEPLLACHDKNLFEIFAYSETIREDPITTRYQQQVDHWIPTIGLSDDALVEKIRSDGIDILVDLAGHTGRNRLGVFARKPTPISLHWLDYGYTTGLSAIDYYMTDVATAPIGSEKLFSEQLWRLPTPSLVYRPATDMGQVGPLPATQCGHVTFGTLTRAIRINHHTIRVWSEILHQVEGSRLIIDSGNFKDPTMRQSLVDKFIDQDIDKSRLEIGYHSPPWDVLRATDIGLDCFPHNSGTTLFENLYMGIPFITLANKPGIGRLGCMVLEGADHPEWIADTEDDYIKKAVALASNLPELASLRNSLRDDLQNSPLMDEQGFTKKVEDAYLEMFRQWRDTTKPRRNRNEHVSSAGKEKVIVADMATSHYNLGVDHQRQNQLTEAKNEYIQTINLRHNFIKAYNNLGVIFQQQGKFDEAKASFLKALEFKADYTDACYNLANTYKMEHELFDAEAAYRQVIAIAPNYTEAHFNLGNILQEQGRPQEAELSLHHALTLNPNHIKAFSTLLFALNYHPDKSAAEVFQAYREFNTRFCQPHHDKWLAHTNIEAGNRRLKVAYVAPAYNKHPARYFVEPLLAHHDKGSMETYAYIERSQEEAATDLFHNYVDHWISTTELMDDQLSKQIRSDGIDILVDLAGHTAGNRLGVFARKPAPVSLHWLDFGYTTGLTAIDYYLTDQATVPAESEQFFSETPWRLNTPALAYRPPEDIGPVNNLPAEKNGYITFGTLTRAVRINHRTIRVWSEILKRCPGSRLIINSGSFREPSMQEAVAERFSVHGIERERLDIGSQSPPWDILRAIDITLDCFPHNSGTTLIESLYMGVPYITLADRPSVGRLGSSILEGVGHPEWIAKTEEEYIQKALILAGDLPKLAATRMTLRQDMTKSPLMNEQGFTEKVEAAYREMFKLWWNSRQITGQPLSEKKYAALSTNRKQKKDTQKKKSKKNRKGAVPKSTEIDRLTQLFNQGNLTEATQLSRSLTSRFPQHGFGWKVLGPLLHQQGLKEEAIQAMQQATICLPDDPDTFYNLGIAQQQSDLLAEAANSYDKTLQLNKNHLQAQYNLGTVLKELGRLAEAENCYRRALELKPDFFEVHCNLGNILRAQGRLNESIDSYRLALQIRPDSEEALTNLSLALRTQGILAEAEMVCKQALQINPKLAEAHNNLGLIYQDQDRLTEAEPCYQRAIEIKPDYSIAWHNLGTTHIKQGRLIEAEGNLRRAIEFQPESANFYSDLLFLLNNHPDKSSEEIYDAYKIFNSRFGIPLQTKWKPFTNNLKSNRRLKIGYVSSNFYKHSMRHFLEPLLAHHNKEKVEVFAYTDQTSEDAVTNRYKSYVDHWQQSTGSNDDALTEQIRGDGIDILIDLAGHTGGNRLGVFARKPAPVSLHWLDFGYTTGLTAIDYYLTDKATVPEGTEDLFAETPWRIKTPGLAYRPAEGMGDVNSLPALERGYITFGTLTRALRINHRTIRVWSEILKRVEGAHLVIDSSNFKDEFMQTTFANKFIAHGIDRDRLEIGYHSPPWDVLRDLDIGFDCFPHNSGTTLFETLYLGIPFVTLADRPCIGRLGSAILEGVGHPEWIASTEEEYIEIAVALASDLSRLTTMRTSLREEMEKSPLMDEPGFARKVETAYEEMFTKWSNNEQLAASQKKHKNNIAKPAQVESIEHPDKKPTPFQHTATSTNKHSSELAVTNRQPTEPHPGETQQLISLFHQGNLSEAAILARSLTERFPKNGFAWKVLGTILQQQGQLDEALSVMWQALKLLQNDAEFHNNFSILLYATGQYAEAETAIRKALKLNPNYAEAYLNLGDMLQQKGQYAAADSNYNQAIALKKDYAEAYCNISKSLIKQGKLVEAEGYCQKAIQCRPNFAEAYNSLGNSLAERGSYLEAEGYFRKATEYKPEYAEAYNNIGNSLEKRGEYVEAEVNLRKTLQLKPDYAEGYSNLGNVYKSRGMLLEAELSYRQGVKLRPDNAAIRSNLLFIMNNHPDKTAEEIYEEYKTFNNIFGSPLQKEWQPFTNNRETNRRLKVGYVSPNFKKHSTRHFLEPLLAHHDKTRMEVYAYADISHEDDFTARYKSYVDHWLTPSGLNDAALSERIRADGIDILVDLAGHTGGNRLGVFARKPAPISLHWLDFGYTTGLTAIDYYFTDPSNVPAGSEGLFAETPWRIETPCLVYRPGEGMGEVSPLPASQQNYITFGTLTRAVRINHRTIQVWSEILKRVEGAHLVIDSSNYRDTATQLALIEKFVAQGIPPERLEIGYNSPPWDVLRGLDIGLDCFPHNSGTTLLETLYMGVPFITLADRPSVGRLGCAILEGLGHPEWIASTEEEYIELAVNLAGAQQKLATVRANLREEIQKSPLMDEPAFARKVETAYSEMFMKWREEQQ